MSDDIDLSSSLFSGPEASTSLRYGQLTLQVSESEGAAVHSLLADKVFNPAFVLAEAIETGAVTVPGGSVLEFGAASGLPSLLLATQHSNTPRLVTLTDHPSVLHATAANVEATRPLCKCAVKVLPHVWGDEVDSLIAAANGQQYDLVILSDLLWLKDAAKELVRSLAATLAPSGRAWIGAGTYTQQAWIDSFERLLHEAGLSWHEIKLETGWKGTTDIDGLLWNDEGRQPSQQEVREAMSARKANVRVWEARRAER